MLPFPADNFTGNCMDTENPSFVNPLNASNVYTGGACRDECEINYMKRQCACRLPAHMGELMQTDTSFVFCNHSSSNR